MSKVLMICHVSAKIGLGHLSRVLAVSKAIEVYGDIQQKIMVIGDSSYEHEELRLLDVEYVLDLRPVPEIVRAAAVKFEPNVVVFDLYNQVISADLGDLFTWLKERNSSLVSIDSLVEYCDLLDVIWIPSFFFDSSNYSYCNAQLKSGWDSFLIQRRLPIPSWQVGERVLVLTGGGDISGLGETLPKKLDYLLPDHTEIHWVQGPYAKAPVLLEEPRLKWLIHKSPSQLDQLIVQSNYVFTVFGVSFFEVIQYGIPSVVFSPYGDKDNDELDALSKEGVATVGKNCEFAINDLLELMNNDELAKEYSINALKKMSINGAQSLSKEIYSLIESK